MRREPETNKCSYLQIDLCKYPTNTVIRRLMLLFKELGVLKVKIYILLSASIQYASQNLYRKA